MQNYFKFSVTIRNRETLQVSCTTEVRNLTEARKRVNFVMSVLSDTDEVVIRNITGKLLIETYSKGDVA